MKFLEQLNFLSKYKNEEIGKKAIGYLADIHNYKVRVLFTGSFSAGKSSLIDTLVGKKVLPSKVVPTTSKPVYIYPTTENPYLKLHLHNQLTETFTFENFDSGQNIKTKIESDLDKYSIEKYELHCPIDLGMPNYCFIDSPGFNSIDKTHTEITYSLFEEIDIAVFVMNATQPLSKTDLDLLSKLKSKAIQIYIVLNKIDLVDESEQSVQDIIQYTNNQIVEKLDLKNFFIFPVSNQPAYKDDPNNQISQFKTRLSNLLTQEYLSFFEKYIETKYKNQFTTIDTTYSDYYSKEIKEKKKKKFMLLGGLAAASSLLLLFVINTYLLPSYRLKTQVDALNLKSGEKLEEAKAEFIKGGIYSISVLKTLIKEDTYKEKPISFQQKLNAIKILGDIGYDAESAYELLLEKSGDKNSEIAMESIKSLEKIYKQSDATRKIYFKCTSSENVDVSVECHEKISKLYAEKKYTEVIEDFLIKSLKENKQQTLSIIDNITFSDKFRLEIQKLITESSDEWVSFVLYKNLHDETKLSAKEELLTQLLKDTKDEKLKKLIKSDLDNALKEIKERAKSDVSIDDNRPIAKKRHSFRYVRLNEPQGVFIRTLCSQSGDKITLIKHRTTVQLLSKGENEETLHGVTSRWYKVRYVFGDKVYNGCSFGGFFEMVK